MSKKQDKPKNENGSKNKFLFMLYAAMLGALAGAIVWLFLKIMESGTYLLWEYIPTKLGNVLLYPLFICIFGGLLIGIWRRIYGDYPENFEEVILEVKEKKRYDKKPHAILVAAILPLIFGGSIGPEAGLAGVAAALSARIADRLTAMNKKFKELAEMGTSATLSILFRSPLFGIMANVESGGINNNGNNSEEEQDVSFPGPTKLMLYFVLILSGLGVLTFLTNSLGGGLHIVKFDSAVTSSSEAIWFLPLIILGIIFGFLYHAFEHFTHNILKPINKFKIIASILGGVIMGGFAIFAPMLMFSGEVQMTVVMHEWTTFAPVILLAFAILKLLLTSICINTGWRGGHIFPIIFSGVCLGYAVALISGIDSSFAVAAVTTALCGAILKKPVAVIMIMLIAFPIDNIILLSAAAFLGSFISTKNKKKIKENVI